MTHDLGREIHFIVGLEANIEFRVPYSLTTVPSIRVSRVDGVSRVGLGLLLLVLLRILNPQPNPRIFPSPFESESANLLRP